MRSAARRVRSITSNMKPQVLYTSADIHTRIKHIFGQPGKSDRRVALVAYVGTDGSKYLPHPEGLRVICSLSAGGTDADTLRQLVKDKAKVEASDRLHMKVYWSKNRGCVITSANASSNALGRDGLKEAGVWLPSRAVDIDRLIQYASPREIRESDLRKLDMESREQNKTFKRSVSRKSPIRDFMGWYSLPHAQSWKIQLSYWEVSGSAAAVKEEIRSEFGSRDPYQWVTCAKGEFRRNDYVLVLFLAKNGVLQGLEWLFADFVVKLSRTEKRYYSRQFPYHAVQVFSPSKCPPPPFRITPHFRRALRSAINLYTDDRLLTAKSSRPPKGFLRIIEREYARIASGN